MATYKAVLFRADASSTIGTGHIMRDLVLAKQYPDSKIYFATRALQGNLNDKIKQAGYEVIDLHTNTIETLDLIIKKLNINLLVIDHYEIGYEEEKQLKTQNPHLTILSFDDTYEKHYCDILLNQNISADQKRYKGLTPPWCTHWCGADYTLLREEFYQLKKTPKPNNLKYKIFVAMGGVDYANITIKILQMLLQITDIEIDVVSTNANKNIKELQKFSSNNQAVTLHVNSTKIATLMHACNLGIITPSVTANEAYFMQMNFIAILTTDNQKEMFYFLKQKGYKTLKIKQLDQLANYVQEEMEQWKQKA